MKEVFLRCFYHRSCADGITAAAVIQRDVDRSSLVHGAKFSGIGYAPPLKVSNHICRAGSSCPDWTREYWVMFVDFTPPVSSVRDLAEMLHLQGIVPGKLMILDHHQEIPEDQIQGYKLDSGWREVEIIIDKNMSGASLAWKFAPMLLCGDGGHRDDVSQYPPLVRYVEDRDLWRFRYGDLSRIIGYGTSYEITLAGGKPAISSWVWTLDDVSRYLDIGARIFDNFVTKTYTARMDGFWTVFDKDLFRIIDLQDGTRMLSIRNKKPGDPFIEPGILSTVSLVSEVCSFFVDIDPEEQRRIGGPYSVVAMINGKAASFRSRNGDALKIASMFGGGGHRDAAGCPKLSQVDLMKASSGCWEVNDG